MCLVSISFDGGQCHSVCQVCVCPSFPGSSTHCSIWGNAFSSVGSYWYDCSAHPSLWDPGVGIRPRLGQWDHCIPWWQWLAQRCCPTPACWSCKEEPSYVGAAGWGVGCELEPGGGPLAVMSWAPVWVRGCQGGIDPVSLFGSSCTFLSQGFSTPAHLSD